MIILEEAILSQDQIIKSMDCNTEKMLLDIIVLFLIENSHRPDVEADSTHQIDVNGLEYNSIWFYSSLSNQIRQIIDILKHLGFSAKFSLSLLKRFENEKDFPTLVEKVTIILNNHAVCLSSVNSIKESVSYSLTSFEFNFNLNSLLNIGLLLFDYNQSDLGFFVSSQAHYLMHQKLFLESQENRLFLNSLNNTRGKIAFYCFEFGQAWWPGNHSNYAHTYIFLEMFR
jgi:hypothetical protein